MSKIIRIGMDTSKHFFQLHGVDADEQVVLRKKLRRKEMIAFFEKLEPTVVGMEACGASHYWARRLTAMGHAVKLMAPQLVKPYVPRNKNDGRDAEGLCEAASRPQMRYVPVKTAEQQAALMLSQAAHDGLDPPLPEVAGKLGVTDRHLRRIFMQAHGVTPIDYLTTQRLLLAKQLLTEMAAKEKERKAAAKQLTSQEA